MRGICEEQYDNLTRLTTIEKNWLFRSSFSRELN